MLRKLAPDVAVLLSDLRGPGGAPPYQIVEVQGSADPRYGSAVNRQ